MEATIFSYYMSVLVNGIPSKDLEVERGLRQGDPLSPFLFMIIEEDLEGIIRKDISLA